MRQLILLCLMALPSSFKAQQLIVDVVNDANLQREELVELTLSDVTGRGIDPKEMVVLNAIGQQQDYQITHDSLLLFYVSLRPKQEVAYTIKKGVTQEMHEWVTGGRYPTRKDDIAWENDRGAYRVYGPPLQRTGERAYGIDVWTKSTPDLVVKDRYYKDYLGNVIKNDCNQRGDKDGWQAEDLATSFHLDHGDGLDCYAVGPTLGCGAPALMMGDSLAMPYCYDKYKILDNGPLRFTVYLEYEPTKIGADIVTEHRIISLDRGSNYNRMEVWYTGLNTQHDLAAGVVMHSGDEYTTLTGKGYGVHADPTEQPKKYGFDIYTGLVMSGNDDVHINRLSKPDGQIYGHLLGVHKRLRNAEHYVYYFGATWSRGDVRSLDEWQQRTQWYRQCRQAPLQVRVR